MVSDSLGWFNDPVSRFFGGHDPFSVLGSRGGTASPPVQRVDLSRAPYDGARDIERQNTRRT